MDDTTDAFPELIEDLKAGLMNNDSVIVAQIIEDLKKLNTPLNVGIVGKSGSGKSSFVNAFRGIDHRHEEAAPTGCAESTSDIKPYRHPDYPNVTLWDLPGIGTTSFPADKYLELVGFNKFDFYIIISAARFWENDVKLAREIRKKGKKFYFVRTNIDNDMRAAQRSQKSFSEEKSLETIRQNCIEGLQNEVFESPKVFLVSNSDVRLYDFPFMCETFKKDLPGLRRHALLQTVAEINQEAVNKKKDAFQMYIKYLAVLSAGGPAVPVPGLYAGFYIGMIVKVVMSYTAGFGLNIPSLQRFSANMRVPFHNAKAVIRSPLSFPQIIKTVCFKVLGPLAVITALTRAKKMSSFIPVSGTMVAMCYSSFRTHRVLNYFLEMSADDAQKVSETALGL